MLLAIKSVCVSVCLYVCLPFCCVRLPVSWRVSSPCHASDMYFVDLSQDVHFSGYRACDECSASCSETNCHLQAVRGCGAFSSCPCPCHHVVAAGPFSGCPSPMCQLQGLLKSFQSLLLEIAAGLFSSCFSPSSSTYL